MERNSHEGVFNTPQDQLYHDALGAVQESHDSRIIRQGIEAAIHEDKDIDDRTARYIASQLHGGQASALYSLASTGKIDLVVFAEMEAGRETFEPQVQGWVDVLRTCCEARPNKGPIEGWMQRTAERDGGDDEAAVRQDLMRRISAAGVTTFGQVATILTGEVAADEHEDDQEHQSDDFSWTDAAEWTPAQVLAEKQPQQQRSPEEHDTLFGEQADEEVGSVDELGWYGLVKHDARPGGLILLQDEQGFRHVREAETDDALTQSWDAIRHEYERFHEERDAYERATEDAGDANNPGPRIWVASLADYGAGRLHGVWMDATCETDDLQAATRFMLRGSREETAEEWGIFDHEGFQGYEVGEYESLETVSRIAKGIAEHGEAYAAWVSYVGERSEEFLSDERFQDHYLGQWDSTEVYVENLLEECGDYEHLDRLPEHLKPYIKIDTEMMARDYESELYVVECQEGGVFIFDTRC